MPYYHDIYKLLVDSPVATFLDLGCCVGQELRFLATQPGISANQLYGADLEPFFFDLGFRLFRDRDTGNFQPGKNLLTGNLLDSEEAYTGSELVRTLHGGIDAIFASSLFHLWNYETQFFVATRLVRDICRDRVGSVICGRQVGNPTAGMYFPPKGIEHLIPQGQYFHNVESTESFWHDVGKATGMRFAVDAGFIEGSSHQIRDTAPETASFLWWKATREE